MKEEIVFIVAATAARQAEGNNISGNRRAMEQMPHSSFVEPSLNAVEHYLHWSQPDNFERKKGYGMNFGLIAADRTTMRRYPKPGLNVLGEYARRYQTIK